MPKLGLMNDKGTDYAFVFEGSTEEIVKFLKLSSEQMQPKTETKVELQKLPMQGVIDKINAQIEEDRRKSRACRPTSPSRQQVIEQAKADVERLRKTKVRNFSPDVCDRVVITTNRSAGVVHAKIVCSQLGVLSEGTARCEKGDTFNLHIGKAIALHRALQLPVPAVYLNAPQPTKAEVGDLVKLGGKVYRIVPLSETVGFSSGTASVDSIVARTGRIVDDSRVNVGGRV